MEHQAITIHSSWIMLGIAVMTFIFSGIAAVARVGYILGEHEKKLEEKITVKVNRVYQRFDEYKNFVEVSFVRKDMCSLLHADTAKAVLQLKEAFEKDIKVLKEQIEDLKGLITNGLTKRG